MRRCACLLALALAAPLWGAPPALKLPGEVKGDVGAFLRVPADTAGKAVQWYALDPGLNLFPVDLLRDTKTAVVTAPRAGRFRLLGYTAAGDEASAPAVCVVVIGDAPPPVPPGPVPPVPPVPPGPAPIPGDGLHVLMVFDAKAETKLPPGQLDVMYGKDVRDYLKGHCAADASGDGKAYRIWPSTVVADNESPKWQAAFKRERKTLPWIIISNPQKGGGYEGPLPATPEEAIKALKPFGGD